MCLTIPTCINLVSVFRGKVCIPDVNCLSLIDRSIE